MNVVTETAKAVLTIPGTVPQKLHRPAVTFGAFIATLGGLVVSIAPTLPVLHDPIVALLGPDLGGKVAAVVQIFGVLVAARSAHVAATGRSIVPSVDNPPPGTVL